MATTLLIHRLLAFVLLLCYPCGTTAAVIPPPRFAPHPMPTTAPSDLHPQANIYAHPDHPSPPSLNGVPYPVFSLNPKDTSHTVAGFSNLGTCTVPMVFQIRGLPRAIVAEDWQLRSPDDKIAGWKEQERYLHHNLASYNISAGALHNRLRAGIPSRTEATSHNEGETSACIRLDSRGTAVRSVLLRSSFSGDPDELKQPPAQAVMWTNQHCAGRPDSWSLTPPTTDSFCIFPHKEKGDKFTEKAEWRSMRVWYGSKNVPESMFGAGADALALRMQAQIEKVGPPPKKVKKGWRGRKWNKVKSWFQTNRNKQTPGGRQANY